MRKLGYLLILIIILLGLLWLSPWHWLEKSGQTIKKLRGQQITNNSYSGKTYVLPTDSFLQFPLPGIARGLRLSTNASILQQFAVKDFKAHYAIHYQLIDDNNKILLDRTYHHRSFLPTTIVTDDNQVRYTLFFIDPLLIPTLPQPQVISSPLLAKAAYLRLRLASKDDFIKDVAVRVAYQQATPQNVESYQWQRLSKDKKEALAKANIYGFKQLTHHEKLHLLQSESKPIGPDGNEGEEYISRKIYRMNHKKKANYANTSEPEGRYIDAQRLGSISIRANNSLDNNLSQQPILLTFNPVMLAAPTNIQLQWQSIDGREKSNYSFILTKDNTDWSASLAPGLLEINSPTPLYFTADQLSIDKIKPSTDLLTDLKYIRGWQFANTAITYSLYNTNIDPDQSDSIRVDIRQFINPTNILTNDEFNSPIEYEWLDEQGNTLQHGQLIATNEQSFYDWLVKTNTAITEPTTFYFRIPPHAHQLRLQGGNHQLITLYTRPFGLTKQVTVPNTRAFSYEVLPVQPHWFLTRPDKWQQLMIQDRSHLIALQTRKKNPDEAILAGQFEWVEYQPFNTYSRDILVPKKNNSPFRQQAVASTFQPLHQPDHTTLLFDYSDARKQFRASLLFDRDSKEPINIRLTINGHQQQIDTVKQQGEITLPPLTAGQYPISIDAPDNIRWYINYIAKDPTATTSYQRRSVYRLDNKVLTLSFIKQTHEKEILLVQFFPDAIKKGSDIHSTNQGINPIAIIRSEIQRPNIPKHVNRGHTILTREFTLLDIPANAEEAKLHHYSWPVFSTSGQRVRHGKRLFIPLDADLPPGSYTIKLSHIKGRLGYITAYSLVPGEYQRQRFYKEDPQA